MVLYNSSRPTSTETTTLNQDSKYPCVTQFLVGSLQSQGSFDPAGQEVGVRDHHRHKTRLGGTRVRVKNTTSGSRCGPANDISSSLPAGCLHAQRPEPRRRSSHRRSRSSRGRCTRPGPAWRCASSCPRSSGCRSERVVRLKQVLYAVVLVWEPESGVQHTVHTRESTHCRSAIYWLYTGIARDAPESGIGNDTWTNTRTPLL